MSAKKVSCEKNKKHPLFRFIRFCIDTVMPKFTVVGIEKIPEGAAVIVGNHSQIYGPLTAELHFPGLHYTWCTSEMMERDRVASYAYDDFWSKKPVAVRPFFWIIAHIIPRLAEIIFTNAQTIPVYRDKRVLKTFQISVDKLKEGARVIIFPEDYTEYNNIVHRFQRGFIHVGKYYYRQTGKALAFVPMYVCPARKKLYIGDPVYFDPEAKTDAEAERICTLLQDSISELAYALPRHRVVPYPNVSKKDYPYNERMS